MGGGMRLSALAAIFLGLGLAACDPGPDVDRISYGTTVTGSVHYTYAVAAAKAINTLSGDRVQVTVIATGGAVENLARVSRGQIQMGIGTQATIYQAYKGLGIFRDGPMPDLRTLWVHAPSIQAWVVRADSGIERLEDLEGKTFTSGQRGSATEDLTRQMLDVLGIRPDYYRATLGDAVAAVKDGRNNGYVKAGSVNSLDGTTLELRSLTPIRLLGFGANQVEAIQAVLPFISFRTFASEEIPGVPAITMPIQIVGQFTSRTTMTDEQVEAILAGIIDGRDIQASAFPSIEDIDIAQISLETLRVPLHAGAVKFYRSRGYEVPSYLIPPEFQ